MQAIPHDLAIEIVVQRHQYFMQKQRGLIVVAAALEPGGDRGPFPDQKGPLAKRLAEVVNRCVLCHGHDERPELLHRFGIHNSAEKREVEAPDRGIQNIVDIDRNARAPRFADDPRA